MHAFIQPLEKIFKQHANSKRAAWSKAYMLNQFEFYGLVTIDRRKLAKEYMKQAPTPSLKQLEQIVRQCWGLPQREWHYFAVELMAFHKKLWQPSIIELMEYCLVHNSWWDSVDHIASECLTHYFRAFPEKIIPVTSSWNNSRNIWLQRSSIMFQKAFKKDTDTALLSAYILHCKDSPDFFIRKAIGWALREYSKTSAAWVKKFVQQNKLHPLSAREALKRIEKG